MNNPFFHRLQKLRTAAFAHKLATAFVVAVFAYGGYWAVRHIRGSAVETRYVTATVARGTLVSSITGSGQASVLSQVDLKAKASGDVMFIGVVEGQEAGAGALVAQIDGSVAQKAVRDAEANLESAKLALQKLVKPADTLSLLQSENSVARAQDAKQKALEDIKKAYDDGFNAVANAFLDLPPLMSGLQDMLYGSSSSLGAGGQWNVDYYATAAGQYDSRANQFKADVSVKYQAASDAYQSAFSAYKAASRSSATTTVDGLITKTYEATRDIAEAVKSANNLIQLYKETVIGQRLKIPAAAETHLSSLNNYTGITNSHLSGLLSIRNTIRSGNDTVVNADRTIAENTQSLAKLQQGADTLDLASAKLSITQRENALFDAREKLSDYSIRAPFAGTIAKLLIKKADSLGSGAVVATLITRQKLAHISLNEVDAAKIQTGQKAMITFDAIPDLSVSGIVGEIDTIGTVAQGVVTYIVKIGFDTQDARVKSGMSVSAAIITEAKSAALLVPNSALKQQGGMRYVEIVEGDDRATALAANASGAILKNPPRRQNIEIGTASDEFTEIISGLNEGDLIVTRTIQPTAQTTQTQQQSGGLRIPGLNTGGGGGGSRGGGGFNAPVR